LNTYEGMFLLAGSDSAKHWEEGARTIREILERSQAQVLTIEKWDERKLAYIIGRQKRGTYVLLYFMAPPESITPIRRACRLSETIVRQLILRADGYEAERGAEEEATSSDKPALPEETGGSQEDTDTSTTATAPDNSEDGRGDSAEIRD